MKSWDSVNNTASGYHHIRIRLTGAKDVAVCLICGDECELENQKLSRKAILEKMAESHYYKHKLNLKR